MKALRYHARGDFRIDDVPDPEVHPGTVMVDVEWCGVCGSELHEFEEGPIQVPESGPNAVTGETVPVILGHEFAGVVSAVGAGSEGVRVGDRVVVEPLMYCKTCAACRAGDYHLCKSLAIIGIHGVAGGYSPHAVVPAYTVHKLPESVPTDVGALIEPLAVGWHAMRIAHFRAGQTALVLGAGPIGLATLLCVQAAGAELTIMGVRRPGARADTAAILGAHAVLDSSQTNVAEEIMALTNGRGVDVVFETSGSQEAMDTASASVAVGGTIASLAVWAKPGQCDYMTLLLKEATLIGSMCYSNDFQPVIKALDEGRIRGAENMITKRVKLDDVLTDAFGTLLNDRSQHVKVLVSP